MVRSYTNEFVDDRTVRDISSTSNPYKVDLQTDYVFISDENVGGDVPPVL